MTIDEKRAGFERDLAAATTTAEKIKALNALSWVYIRIGKNCAVEYAQQAVDLAANFDDDALYSESLCRLSDAKVEMHEHDQAMELLKTAADISRRNNDHVEAAKADTRLSVILCVKGRYHEALQLNLDGWPALQKNGTLYVQATNLVWMGSITQSIGDLEAALEYYYRGIRILERKGFDSQSAWGYSLAGNSLRELGKLDEALHMALLALRKTRSVHDVYVENIALECAARVLAEIANTRGTLIHKRLAIMCSSRKRRLSAEAKDRDVLIECDFCEGEVLRLCGDRLKAETLLREALRKARDGESLHFINNATLSLARLLQLDGQLEEAENLFRWLVQSARASEQRLLEQDALSELMHMFEVRGKFADALEHSKALLESRTALKRERDMREAARLKARFNFNRVRDQRDRHARRIRELEQELETSKRTHAESSLLLDQKKVLLNKVDARVSKLINKTQSPAVAHELHQLVQEVRRNLNDSNATLFERDFTDVNENYQQKLLQRFPRLSLNDLKVCNLLRMQLRTKEIASLLSLTPRTVEVYRSRIRQKMDLPQATSLTVFLSSIV